MIKNMASKRDELCVDLKAINGDAERDEKFWNTSVVEMKFSVEREWIKAVRKAKGKPNYGMMNMDNMLEEVIGNKLELVGPGARFSKAPETFRARKAIFSYLYLKNREVHRPEPLYGGNLCSH